jgi:hypothetical protein
MPKNLLQDRTPRRTPDRPGRIGVTLAGLAAAALWCGLYLFVLAPAPAGALALVGQAFYFLLPLALIGAATMLAHRVQDLAAEAAALRKELGSLRVDSLKAEAEPRSARASGAARPAAATARPEPSPEAGDSAAPAAGGLFGSASAAPAARRSMADSTRSDLTDTRPPSDEGPARRPAVRHAGEAPMAIDHMDHDDLAARPAPARPAEARTAAQPAPRPSRAGSGHQPGGNEDLTLPDLIRALHFPETPDDMAGFRALQRALRHHKAGQVVQAAQDMLTLLSQDGLYMDDIEPEVPQAGIWRRIAAGDRQAAAPALAATADEAAFRACAERMRSNTVYRDTAQHFLRRFDQMLADMVPEISDEAIEALAATRSARAFLLVGRAAGVFEPA